MMRRICYMVAAALLCVASAVLSASCSDDVQEQYSDEYRCYFTFDTQLHPTSMLTLAVDNPGSFVMVSASLVSGRTVLDISNWSGTAEQVPINTDKENYLIGSMGANSSIIVGCSTFNGMRAYDAQCPNCLHDYSGRSFPLSWTANGQALTCAKCSRRYELNYEGRADSGRALLQYRVERNGVSLVVRN